jgi:uroporphyrinogen-III synthase
LSLQGKTILVTRQKEQSAEFVEEIESLGGRALVFPMIRITAPDSWQECDSALERIESYQALLFTSANGVEGFFGRSTEKKVSPEGFRAMEMMAVGKKTKERIEERGYQVRMVPENFSAQSLTAAVKPSDVAGKNILAPQGNLARDEIQRGLTELGAAVDPVPVYKNVKPLQSDGRQLWRHLEKREIDVVTFCSPSALTNFSAFVSPQRLRLLQWTVPIAVIGPTTRDAAVKKGYEVAIMGTVATVKGLVRAIDEFCAE